jgi:RHS repeat-associated protein
MPLLFKKPLSTAVTFLFIILITNKVSSQTLSVKITGTEIQCSPGQGSYSANAINNISPTTYDWYRNNQYITFWHTGDYVSPTSNISGMPYVYVPPSQYPIQVGDVIYCIATSNGQTATSNSITVVAYSQLPLPTAVINSSAPFVCQTGDLTFTTTYKNINNYTFSTPTWHINYNPSHPYNTNTATTDKYTTNQSSNGLLSGTVVVDVTASDKCKSYPISSSYLITNYYDLPIGVTLVSSPTILCPGQTITFTAVPSTDYAPFVYEWMVNGVLQVGVNTKTYTTSSLQYTDQVSVRITASSTQCLTGPNTVTSQSMLVDCGGNSLTIQPDAREGKDACINSYSTASNSNYGAISSFNAQRWTNGSAFSSRSLIQFDLSSIPPNATILNAKLVLFGIAHNPLTQPNSFYINRITSPWNESTITWYNQPTSSNVGQVALSSSSSATQDYYIDVTPQIQDMYSNTANNFGFMMQLQNEIDTYAKIDFASSDYSDASKWPKVSIIYSVPTTIPGIDITKNWNSSSSFDENGVKIGENKSFYNNLGKPIQTQVKSITDNNVIASQTIFDELGRPVLKSLPAPLNQTTLIYKDKFITNASGNNYSFSDFDLKLDGTLGSVNNPANVDNTIPNTLGYFYSDNNAAEPFVPTSLFPYSRIEFDVNNPGKIKRNSMAGDELKMGSGRESQSYTMFVSPGINELNYMFGKSFSAADKAIKTISIDQNGTETISFIDFEGNSIASCLNGPGPTGSGVTMLIKSVLNLSSTDVRFFDVHLNNNNNLQITNIPSTEVLTWNILNLKTGKYITYNSDGSINSSGTGVVDYTGKSPNLPAGIYRIINTKGSASSSSTATLNYNQYYYNFSLYNYDKSNHLISIVPPAGSIDLSYNPNTATAGSVPNFNMKTSYEYNSLGWKLSETTPDAGKSQNVYRKDGSLRFSQNAIQVGLRFSYINYDLIGRPLETGEFSQSPGSLTFQSHADFETSPTTTSVHLVLENISTLDPATVSDPNPTLPAANCSQQTKIIYDVADPSFYTLTGLSTTAYSQDFLIGKISKTKNDYCTSWYSYDEFGQTTWMVQRIEGMNEIGSSSTFAVKTVNYTYDKRGNILQVAYQIEKPSETFYHQLEYDLDKRLKKVSTSTNGIKWEEQSRYYYYLHGPLKRMEIANKMQGLDYIYTINGWLKSINSPELNAHDPGIDGYSYSKNHASKDLFGMSLDYYGGDYLRLNTNVQAYDNSNTTLTKNSYNGLIKAQRWQTVIPVSAQTTLKYQNQQLMTGYLYDNQYQLTSSIFGTITSNGTLNGITSNNPSGPQNVFTTVFSASDDYKVSGILYDPNGNIKALSRNGHLSLGLPLDNLSYAYTAGSNKLTQVNDAVGSNANYSPSFDFKTGSSAFQYDGIGQLIKDVAQNTITKYDAYGKVTGIYNATTNVANVKFIYDDKGQRLCKQNISTSGSVSKETWYIRNGSGNLLSMYEKDYSSATPAIKQTEVSIYGSGRLGVLDKTSGISYYEISDHLGNVRTIFSKTKDLTLASGFEGSGDKDYLIGFNAIDNTKSRTVNTPSGTASIKTDITSPYGAGIGVPVTEGQIINATIYYQHSAASPPPAGLVFSLENADVSGSSSFGWNRQIVGAQTGTSWQPISFSYTIPAAPAGVKNMVLNIYPWYSGTVSYGPVWFDDLSISISPNTSGEGGFYKPKQESLTDYYPHGGIMPLRTNTPSFNYRYDYQGQNAEKDGETGQSSFELRMYDGKLARWLNTDPYGQYHSPYLGMGNNPVNSIDQDGGFAEFIVSEGKTSWISKVGDSEGIDYYHYVDGINAGLTVVTATVKGFVGVSSYMRSSAWAGIPGVVLTSELFSLPSGKVIGRMVPLEDANWIIDIAAGGLAGIGKAMLSRGGAVAAEVSVTKGLSVIGPRTSYREFAKKIGAKFLDVTDEAWDMRKNVKFLQDVIKRGDDVLFSGKYNPSLLNTKSVLAQEIRYLQRHGYSWSKDFTRLIKK